METLAAPYSLTVAGMEILLTPGDRVVGRLQRDGDFEPQSLEYWTKKCQPGKSAVDVGGYNGLFSIVAAKRGSRCFTFEPLPTMQKVIKANRTLNDVEFELQEAAASDETGKRVLLHNARLPYTAGATFHPRPGIDTQRLLVKTMRIDDLKLNDCAAIKIDTEKHEISVLQGARETIARCHPAMLIEVLPDQNEDAVMAELPGYRVLCRRDVRNIACEWAG